MRETNDLLPITAHIGMLETVSVLGLSNLSRRGKRRGMWPVVKEYRLAYWYNGFVDHEIRLQWGGHGLQVQTTRILWSVDVIMLVAMKFIYVETGVEPDDGMRCFNKVKR